MLSGRAIATAAGALTWFAILFMRMISESGEAPAGGPSAHTGKDTRDGKEQKEKEKEGKKSKEKDQKEDKHPAASVHAFFYFFLTQVRILCRALCRCRAQLLSV